MVWIIIGAWIVLSLPLGLLAGAALSVSERNSVSNLPTTLSPRRYDEPAELKVAA
ncbi:MAG: hypothetical protein JO246_04005 [Frankiaceae bacterium]|nr:hypothetical protein [Frankiaceae bacterium]MBV9870124.1 hypothetical protein [Frankiaceae bacterium]